MMNKRFLLLITLIALCILGLAKCNPFVVSWPTPATSHLPIKTLDLGEIWSLTNIYSEQDDFMPMIVASAGKLMFVGSFLSDDSVKLYCLDGSTGSVVWEGDSPKYNERGYLSTISAVPDGLYVGYGGVPSVKKFDLTTGDVLWSQSLSGRGLLYIFVFENEVQISTFPEWFSRLDVESGDVIEQRKDRDVIISSPQITISHILMNQLQADDTATGEMIWRISLDRELRMAPLFSDDVIYLRSGRTMGSIYAVKSMTGEILWKTDHNIISNIAISPAKRLAYVLTRDGKLLGIDIDTGVITTLIEFSNGPFILNGEEIVGGYELAYDSVHSYLYILLGDSRQLLAFKEEG